MGRYTVKTQIRGHGGWQRTVTASSAAEARRDFDRMNKRWNRGVGKKVGTQAHVSSVKRVGTARPARKKNMLDYMVGR